MVIYYNINLRGICGDCGSWYGSKVWHSNDKYRKVIYCYNRKYGDEKCLTHHVTEDDIKEMFVKAFNKLFYSRKEIISKCGTDKENAVRHLKLHCRTRQGTGENDCSRSNDTSLHSGEHKNSAGPRQVPKTL